MKIYTVVKNNFEYNDEIYCQEDGGHIVASYKNQKQANEEALRLTFYDLRGQEIGMYCYNLEEINLDRDFIEQTLNTKYDKDDYLFRIPKVATDDQLKILLRETSLSFYKVIENELVE